MMYKFGWASISLPPACWVPIKICILPIMSTSRMSLGLEGSLPIIRLCLDMFVEDIVFRQIGKDIIRGISYMVSEVFPLV